MSDDLDPQIPGLSAEELRHRLFERKQRVDRIADEFGVSEREIEALARRADVRKSDRADDALDR